VPCGAGNSLALRCLGGSIIPPPATYNPGQIYWVSVRLLLLAAALALPMAAQTLLPARPGVILYREGEVWLDRTAVEISPAGRLEMYPNAALTTGNGRAEVLLNPCTLLHLGERGSLRMVVNSLTAARLELLAGSAVVEADGGSRIGSVEVMIASRVVRIAQSGVYRFDTAPPRLRVYFGAAELEGGPRRLAGGLAVDLTSVRSGRFDRKQVDALQEWNDYRVRTLMDESGIVKFDRPRICTP